MSTQNPTRVLAVILLLLTVGAFAPRKAAAEGIKPVNISNGEQGTLIIDIREKRGALVLRKDSYAVATLLMTKKRWQRLVDTWHVVQTTANEGRAPTITVLKMGEDKRLEIETGKNVKFTFIDETTSQTFTLYPDDFEVFNDAVEKVLSRLED